MAAASKDYATVAAAASREGAAGMLAAYSALSKYTKYYTSRSTWGIVPKYGGGSVVVAKKRLEAPSATAAVPVTEPEAEAAAAVVTSWYDAGMRLEAVEAAVAEVAPPAKAEAATDDSSSGAVGGVLAAGALAAGVYYANQQGVIDLASIDLAAIKGSIAGSIDIAAIKGASMESTAAIKGAIAGAKGAIVGAM